VTLKDPWGFDGKTYDGQEMRLMIAALTAGRGGVAAVGDYKAAAQGTPNNTVSVAAGTAIIPATSAGLLGSFEVPTDAALTSPTFSPTGANPRWDLLLLQVVAGVAQLTVVPGTAAGSPAEPSLAAQNDYIRIARIQFPASTTNIDASMIVDQRSFTSPAFPCTSTTRPATPFDGQIITETDTNTVRQWDAGTATWIAVGLRVDPAGSLPAAPLQGTAAYVSDTNWPTGAMSPLLADRPKSPGLYVFDQRWDPPWNLPWGHLGHVAIIDTAAGIGTGGYDCTQTLTIPSHPANRRLRFRGKVNLTTGTGGGAYIVAKINSVIAGSRLDQQNALPGSGAILRGDTDAIITAGGAIVASLGIFGLGAGLTVDLASAADNGLIALEDIGPAGQPA
jgi:hypothetical protein